MEKTTALTRRTFVEKVMSLFFNMLFGLVSTFAGASLADNLPDLLLGSSFADPSVELTFLLGILA